MEQVVNPKQQATEAIRQAESVLITAGARPTVDQTVAVLALAQILRKAGKRVNAVISDQLPSKIGFLPLKEIGKDLSGLRDFIMRLDLSKAEVDKLRYTIEDGKLNLFITPFTGSFNRDDLTYDYGDYNYDLAIVLGVPSRDRVDRAIKDKAEFFQKVPIINIDFHRSNENFGAVNLIDTQAASLCEILAGLAESLQVALDENIATALLAGLYASTDRFTAVHTSAKSLTLSAQLIAAGARQQQVVKSLFPEKPEATPEPKIDHSEQAKKNQEELKKLAELKNPQPKAEKPKHEPNKVEQPKPEEKVEELPEVKAEAKVEAEGPAEDLEPEAHVEFELPEHIKSGLANFLES